jgi:hypothetical protein
LRKETKLFCKKCGNPVVSTKFCSKCGAPVALETADIQAAQISQPLHAKPPVQQPRKTPVPPTVVAQKRTVPPPPRSVPPPPKAQQAKPPAQDSYLNGIPFTPADDANTRHQGNYGSGHAASDSATPAAAEKQKKKVDGAFKTYTPGETGMFGSMLYMISDPETFFTRADFTKEVGTAFMIIFLVNIVRGFGSLLMKLMILGKMPTGKSLDAIMIGAAFAFIYPFLVSVMGMLIMSLMYRAFASWKRIFGIYAFASVPYLISFLPFCSLISFIAFVYYARKGFENVFGLDSTVSLLFALGLPIVFWGIVILGYGSAVMMGGR